MEEDQYWDFDLHGVDLHAPYTDKRHIAGILLSKEIKDKAYCCIV